MQLSLESIVAVEYLVPGLLAVVFAIGYSLKKRVVKAIIFLLTSLQAILVSFRPVEYNSDTSNYASYLETLSDAKGTEFLLLTKFEPIHLLLAGIAQDFRLWLLLEAVTAIALLWLVIRRVERLETLAVVIGTSLPLMSSSIRFAVGLLAISYVLTWRRNRRQFLWLSLVGGITHISLAITGVLNRRKWLITWTLLGTFFIVAAAVSSIIERAGVNETGEIRPAGMRSFACLIAFILYLRIYLPEYRKTTFASDLLSATGILVLSVMFFPVVNRWLITLLVVVALESDSDLDCARVPRQVGHIVATVIYFALVVPFLYTVAMEISSGERFVGAPAYSAEILAHAYHPAGGPLGIVSDVRP